MRHSRVPVPTERVSGLPWVPLLAPPGGRISASAVRFRRRVAFDRRVPLGTPKRRVDEAAAGRRAPPPLRAGALGAVSPVPVLSGSAESRVSPAVARAPLALPASGTAVSCVISASPRFWTVGTPRSARRPGWISPIFGKVGRNVDRAVALCHVGRAARRQAPSCGCVSRSVTVHAQAEPTAQSVGARAASWQRAEKRRL